MMRQRDWRTAGRKNMVSHSALSRRPLGRTALEVSALGFGTAPHRSVISVSFASPMAV
jgi:hypothetical protein